MKNKFISSIWDFSQPTFDTMYSIHNFFRWYGKLPQLLVRKLMELYSKENDLVLANFVGSGTVSIEANLANRKSVGVDPHPLSCLLCQVKTTPIILDTDTFLTKVRKRLDNRSETLLFDIPQAEKWFYKESLIDLQHILDEVKKLDDEKERNFYTSALMNIVRDASKVDARCINHIVVDENKPKVDVFREFSLSVTSLKNSLKEFKDSYHNIQTDVFVGDARKLNFLEDNSIDLIISHPPYLGAILYHNIYRLETDLLGFSYNTVRAAGISMANIKSYVDAMKKVFDEMYRVLKPEKYACVIIGDTRKDGDIIPTFAYFVEYATKNGFRLRDIFIWILGGKAGMNVARRGNYIDHNYVLIFQKKKND